MENKTLNTNPEQLTLTPSSAVPINKRAAARRRADWLVPAGLIILTAIPFAAGIMRLVGLASGAEVTPENARFVAMPLPVVIHILTALPYCILGAFQFTTGSGRRRLGWHRAAGWLLVPCGLAVALSGLWMTMFYPRPAEVGDLLTGMRLVFGTGMVLSIGLGFAAIRRRDIAEHRAWMIRGYAIGIGAGTQVLTHVPYFIMIGEPDQLTHALLMGAGWAINLAVAEWIIRSHRSRGRPEQVSGYKGRDLIERLVPGRR